MEKFLSTGCLILGILCFLYFVVIVAYAGIRTSICWIWTLGGALFLFLWRALSEQGELPGNRLRLTAGVLLALILAGTAVVLYTGGRVVSAMSEEPRADLDYVIVLGAQVKGTRPSRALRRRLDEALSYADENPRTVFILSGGRGPDEDISEAGCMYRYLTERKMAPERLRLEERSTSTRENLEFSDQLYALRMHSVGILSNNFHLERALTLARGLGYQNVSGIPASADPLMQPHNILREICCILLERLRSN